MHQAERLSVILADLSADGSVEVVLEGGQNTVVFRDEERGAWFTQRGA